MRLDIQKPSCIQTVRESLDKSTRDPDQSGCCTEPVLLENCLQDTARAICIVAAGRPVFALQLSPPVATESNIPPRPMAWEHWMSSSWRGSEGGTHHMPAMRQLCRARAADPGHVALY
ncbi:hypothetical protein ElyMa_000823100 [Elysia marginata]|uniref:Uncharacterized protein n=1 Tax=Elysia marginata TaxID=1093978 RepID=A0AAV4GXH6_9GAST|nr:hypothetical protein ElyMa_000823100 [Elysia marginata]